MQILVLEVGTNGPEPEINEITAYGYVLLDQDLEVTEEGNGLVRPRDLELTIGDEALIGKSKRDFLELLDDLCYEPTILASRNLYLTRNFWQMDCQRQKVMMPLKLETIGLDVYSIEVANRYQELLDLPHSMEAPDPYKLYQKQYPFIDPCLAQAKATTCVLRTCLKKTNIVVMEKPYEKPAR